MGPALQGALSQGPRAPTFRESELRGVCKGFCTPGPAQSGVGLRVERTDSRPLGKLDRAANEAPGDALGGKLGQGAGLWEVWEGSEVKVKDSRGVNTQQGRWLPWRWWPGSREPRMEPQRGAWRGPGPLNGGCGGAAVGSGAAQGALGC